MLIIWENKLVEKHQWGIISRLSWIDKIHERTINLKNKDDKCFQYAATVALNHRQIKRNPDRVLNIEPFISKN